MNTLVKERKVISMTYSKKESYSLVQTNELSDILTIKEELKNLKAELITFKDSVMANLEMKQNSNELNYKKKKKKNSFYNKKINFFSKI